jgi:hypothetical protein
VTGPRHTVYINGDRHYDHNGLHVGWTSALGRINKPALPQWYANQAAKRAADNRKALADMTDAEAYEFVKGAANSNRNGAARKGTEVHEIVGAMIKGEDIDASDAALPWVAGAQAFVDDVRPVVSMIETSVYTDRLMAAGTFDLLASVLPGVPSLPCPCLIDLKAGNNVWPEAQVQVTAYGVLSEYWLDDSDRQQEWQRPASGLIVHLQPGGHYRLFPCGFEEPHRRAALAALELYRWEKTRPELSAIFVPPPEPAQVAFDVAYNKAVLVQFRADLQQLGPDITAEVQRLCVDRGYVLTAQGMTADAEDFIRGQIRMHLAERMQRNG